MGRGGRSAAADKKKKKKKKKKKGKKTDNRAAAPSSGLILFDQVLGTSEALRVLLASLGATTPSLTIEKRLEMSDVSRNQARLLFSWRCESLALCPLTPFFTELEVRRVNDKLSGLLVTALDYGGRSYDLTCKYLDCNNGYRFITGWTTFLQANALELDGEGRFLCDMIVELWAFRSQALPNRIEDKKKINEETDHPDGSLGLVLLLYEYGEHGGSDQEEEGTDEALTSTKVPVA